MDGGADGDGDPYEQYRVHPDQSSRSRGGRLNLYSTNITGLNKVSSRTDNLNLTGQTLPAGTYTGVLRIQARAI